MAESHTDHRGFHGPKCWVISIALGAVLGWVLALAFPAVSHHATATPGGRAAPTDGAAVLIIQQAGAGGPRLLRLSDGSTVELPTDFDPARPSDLDAARQLADTRPAISGTPGHPTPETPLALCIPFALLLLSIAVMPFISARFWHAHYADFAFLLGALVLVYCLVAYGEHGRHTMLHAGIEYYAFIALIGGLYVASGGILVDIRHRGTPWTNTALLAIGSVLANIVGTTGASVLLIRPFMRMNQGRLRPMHVVFFIFIVSNCGGCLTPIGDPPLYLGFLKGVPFFWTLANLWPMWLLVNGALLVMFFIADSRVPGAAAGFAGGARRFDPQHRTPLIAGWPAAGMVVLLVACVFVDPLLKKHAGVDGVPVGATLQIVIAIAAFVTSRPSIRHANQFTFAPVKEVGFLFAGIFLTMAPALEYLHTQAPGLGLRTPTHFYFSAGALSALLDNAPTYLSFLQVAFGVLHLPLNSAGIAEFIAGTFDLVHLGPVAAGATEASDIAHFSGHRLLSTVSLAAVFFGAMTYIGNGPNFMVKSIVDAAYARSQTHPGEDLGVKMPSFFGFVMYSLVILLPVVLLNWLVFVR